MVGAPERLPHIQGDHIGEVVCKWKDIGILITPLVNVFGAESQSSRTLESSHPWGPHKPVKSDFLLGWGSGSLGVLVFPDDPPVQSRLVIANLEQNPRCHFCPDLPPSVLEVPALHRALGDVWRNMFLEDSVQSLTLLLSVHTEGTLVK